MNISIKIRTNPPPCKHTVVTVTEDGKTRDIVFHDSDFDNDDFMPDDDSREIFKVIKERLKVTGKKLSKLKADFDGKVLTHEIKDEDEQ